LKRRKAAWDADLRAIYDVEKLRMQVDISDKKRARTETFALN
jgi:hypothetical protein